VCSINLQYKQTPVSAQFLYTINRSLPSDDYKQIQDRSVPNVPNEVGRT